MKNWDELTEAEALAFTNVRKKRLTTKNRVACCADGVLVRAAGVCHVPCGPVLFPAAVIHVMIAAGQLVQGEEISDLPRAKLYRLAPNSATA